MRSQKECIREAERCEQYAASFKNETLRVAVLEIASTWRMLADSKESHGLNVLGLMEIGAQFSKPSSEVSSKIKLASDFDLKMCKSL